MFKVQDQGVVVEVKACGRVIEARDGIMGVMYPGGFAEHWCAVKPNDAAPGDYVWIYDDGRVEVKSRPTRLPGNVTETVLPTSIDGQGS